MQPNFELLARAAGGNSRPFCWLPQNVMRLAHTSRQRSVIVPLGGKLYRQFNNRCTVHMQFLAWEMCVVCRPLESSTCIVSDENDSRFVLNGCTPERFILILYSVHDRSTALTHTCLNLSKQILSAPTNASSFNLTEWCHSESSDARQITYWQHLDHPG